MFRLFKLSREVKALKSQLERLQTTINTLAAEQQYAYGDYIPTSYLGVIAPQRHTLPVQEVVRLLVEHAGVQIKKQAAQPEKFVLERINNDSK